ncbi:MAG: transglycosylase SLT domain-containing protein [Immundisolibacterales bacterium]|nr:transglycosylase SLT domain-containing protein [Immundisolibacterales bacterium]
MYLEARTALRRGQLRRFERLSESIEGHPLHPWLRYLEFRRNFGRHSDSAIEAFLATVPDTPMADIVRVLWLDRLARQLRWARFLDVYSEVSPNAIEIRHKCQRARAFFETGADLSGFKATARLWQVPRSQDKSCDRTFALWTKRGGRTPELLWSRIELSLRRGNRGLAGYVARLLDQPDRGIAERWIRDHRRPARIVSRANRVEREPAWRRPVTAAIASLARRTPDAAARAWRSVSKGSSLPVDLDAFAAWRIGLGYVQEHRFPEAVEWIESVPAGYRSPRLLGILALLSFAEGRWADSLAALEALPPDTRTELRWRYWRARVLTALGRAEEAGWRELAAERDYYGFLAADRIDAPYRIVQEPAGSPPETLERIERMGGYRRALEFKAIGFRNRLDREWRHLVHHLEGSDLAAAAELATRQGWHFKAIRAAAKAEAFDRLDLRFPIAWRDEAETAARQQGIDAALVLATIRMESAFRPNARSSAGALGLMQVMPATGRRIAKAAGVRVTGRRTLLNPEKNIRLGAAYLSRVLRRMNGHPALASASYNAGPHRAVRWLAAAGGLEPELWVEFIPYTETRQYVKRILEYRIVYRHRLRIAPIRLSELLPPLPEAVGDSR